MEKQCTRCGELIPMRAKVCPRCGADLRARRVEASQPQRGKKSTLSWEKKVVLTALVQVSVFAVMIVVATFWLVVG